MIITSIPDLALQYDEPLGLLRVQWASGEDMRSFRASAEQLMQLMRRLELRHLLLDINSFADISVYDQVWLGVNWMPALVKLPLERVVLALHRRRVHNQLAVDSLIAMSRPFIKFDIQFFPANISAMRWLSDYSERLPDLLAEWDGVFGPDLGPAALAQPKPGYLASF